MVESVQESLFPLGSSCSTLEGGFTGVALVSLLWPWFHCCDLSFTVVALVSLLLLCAPSVKLLSP